MKENKVVSKKLFTRQEVEEYTKRTLTSVELTMCEQRDLIVELKKEIDNLTSELNIRQQKIEQLERAILESNRLNKQSKKDGDIKTKLLIEKLQHYGEKWKVYFEGLFKEVEVLKSNASIELFSEDTNNLIDEILELGNMRLKASDKVIPSKSEFILNEESLKEQSLLNEGKEDFNLSKKSEDKYKNVLDRLKKQMIFASELTNSGGVDMEEALNPTQSLKDIIKDLKED